MRVWTERVYGIPPEQVVGTTGKVRYELRDGKPELTKTTDYIFVNDKAGKPAGIHEHIGRRPAGEHGWTVVDMKLDWNTIFGD